MPLPTRRLTRFVPLAAFAVIALGLGLALTNDPRKMPSTLIDRNVNPNQIPTDQDFASVNGPSAPVFRFREEVFFLQTLNFGFELHY